MAAPSSAQHAPLSPATPAARKEEDSQAGEESQATRGSRTPLGLPGACDSTDGAAVAQPKAEGEDGQEAPLEWGFGDGRPPLRGSRQHMKAEAAALDAATEVIEALLDMAAGHEPPNPDAVEAAANCAIQEYLAEDSGGAVAEGALERATDFVRRALVGASNGDVCLGDCPAWRCRPQTSPESS